MKAKLLSITAAAFIFFILGCEKNQTGPKIHLKLKSVNATEFNLGERVLFKFEFTPKDNISDTLFVARKFYTCPFITTDTVPYPFPAFENKTRGELEYAFTYGSGGVYNDGCYNVAPFVRRTDSLHYSFWIKDNSGNVSDTIVSPKIILKR